MTKAKLEDKIEQLRQLRSATPNDEVISILRKALRDRSNLIVAEAAKTIAHFHLSKIIPDLLEAFDRLFEDPVKKDSKCWGKTAIVKALTQLEYSESPPFIHGARHIQMEPVWGGQEDAAAQLRAACYLALVQCDLSRTEIFRHLVDAMADAADPVRLEAVRAIAQMNGEEASLLLRLKARIGDRRPAVTGQVFDALLGLEPERALPFVANYLQAGEAEVREEAALALGASRLSQAIKVLIDTWNQTRSQEFRNVLLRSLSSSRQPAAIDFLLNLVRTGVTRDASFALEALKLHEGSPEIQARVEQAKKQRSDS